MQWRARRWRVSARLGEKETPVQSEGATHILVVDDDLEIRKLLGRYLAAQGFRVTTAGDGREMEEKLATQRIDFVVLDLMLPDASGLDLCRALRNRSRIPVILLTALKEDVDRIIGLEIGADDYLGKPFNPRELVARIRAVLRRTGGAEPEPVAASAFRFARFRAEPELRRVTDGEGVEIQLTGAEFDLLMAFLERPGRILSREQLLDITRGREAGPFDRSVDVLVSRLRRKLGDQGAFQILKTLRNGGYQLAVRVDREDAS
ncbi:response regulator [Xanthobacter oligotrophicus]|uniref:response regulator n=1 Tax=Xanthobacter oligotrophicus TaxID=2607286 RepID=UPI001E60785C|nr:response regulator transcription factor [Xanthobacter oligotrophicus]MCG5234817.1 response regulator transcription factor [Xanthobacter oligotrophicus]